MSISFKLSELEFGSLLSYSPAGSSEPERRSKSIMTAIKNDKFIGDPPILTSEFISNSIKEKMTTLPFGYFFRTNPVLVPIPNSSLMRPNTLWVSRRLADALYRNGLGISVENLLERFRPLRKAATCTAQNRPKVSEHYNSLNIQKGFHNPREILLIDDIVTRGATLLGAANRLRETFPMVHVRAFAAIRSISPPFIFEHVYDPRKGLITLNGQETFRKP
jgi:hypothetical protein